MDKSVSTQPEIDKLLAAIKNIYRALVDLNMSGLEAPVEIPSSDTEMLENFDYSIDEIYLVSEKRKTRAKHCRNLVHLLRDDIEEE
jgi:hypothetical protein